MTDDRCGRCGHLRHQHTVSHERGFRLTCTASLGRGLTCPCRTFLKREAIEEK